MKNGFLSGFFSPLPHFFLLLSVLSLFSSSFSPGHLIVHRRIHIGEKPYVCEDCGYATGDPSSLIYHRNHEACWYSQTVCMLWENLCQAIANILFAGLDWSWQIRIYTTVAGHEYVVPEIVIRNPDGSLDFIDAKRSNGAFTYNDVVIYPQIAKKVTFWCLFGKVVGLFEDDPTLSVVSSEQLIKLLEDHETAENSEEIQMLILRINLLKKGLDSTGQPMIP